MRLVVSSKVLFLLSTVILAQVALAERAFRGEFIIKEFKSAATVQGAAVLDNVVAGRGMERITQGDGFSLVRRIRAAAAIAGATSAPEQEEEVVEVSEAEIAEACAPLLKSKQVKYCEPNYELRTTAVPNDTSYSQLWGMTAANGIDAPRAWDRSTGGEVIVGIIDTGIDYNHPDLAANIWVNPGEIAGNNIDDDGNGWVDDVHGINAAANNGNPMDDNSHGTHCAGTIGGIGNNARGVAGVNWRVKMIGVKFLTASGSGSLANAVKGIKYLTKLRTQKGIPVVLSSNSWGGGGYSQALNDAISEANAAGILFVAAAGNEATDNDSSPHYPSGYDFDNVLTVAAVDQSGNLASFSNYGATTVDIAAPGVSILSTTPGNSYASYSGTSMATPHVSGAIALLKAYEPALSMAELKARVLEAGKGLTSLSGVVRSGRMLNVGKMLANEVAPIPPLPEPPARIPYAIEQLPYSPEPGIAGAVEMQADELSYLTLNLPFTFPFYGKGTETIKISPNGVIYMGTAPGGMDYAVGSKAPNNSVAVLHTDLYAASGSAYGVRTKKRGASEPVSIEWFVKQYANQNAGDIRVQADLYPSGEIKLYYSVSSSTLLSYLNLVSLIGLAGPSSNNVDTYSGNIPNSAGLSMTPQGTVPSEQYRIHANSGVIRGGAVNRFTLEGPDGASGTLALKIRNLRCDLKNTAMGAVELKVAKAPIAGNVRLGLYTSAGQVAARVMRYSVGGQSRSRMEARGKKLQKIRDMNGRSASQLCRRFQRAASQG